MGTKLITLDDLVNRTIKSVNDIEVKEGANCTIIVVDTKDKKELEFVVLQGRGCGKCYGGIDEVVKREAIPKEVKAWIFDNLVS